MTTILDLIESNTMTVIEYRDECGKLRDGWFDETLLYIQREVLSLFEQGCTQFEVIRNDRNYDFHWLSNY